MVLVAFVLVLLAAATFAAGIAASRTSDALVYLSIAFSVAAFIVLAIASLRARQAAREAPAGSWPAEPTRPMRTIDETEAHAGALIGGLDPSQLDMTPSWRRQRRPERDPVFAELDDDEAFDAQLENEEDEADFEVPVEAVVAARQPDDLWWGSEDADEEEPTAAFSVTLDKFDDDSDLDIPELAPEPEAPENDFFDEYDDLTAAEILSLVREFDLDDLEWVRARERSGAKRATVLNQVEQLIAEKGGRPAPRKRAAAKKAAPKKAAPARRAAKKSTRRR